MDDDEPITRMLRKVLESRGHEVYTASNGREGMRLFGSAPVDLVISDILMPEMDGIETLKELLHRNPSLKLIAVSGGGTRLKMDILKVARILGASATFEKPYNLRELMARVDELLAEQVRAPDPPAAQHKALR
jgi:DNA-binding response OmpR family regulator